MRSTAPTRAAGRAGGPRYRLCAGGGPRPPRWSPLATPTRRRPAQAGPGAGLAVRVRRPRRQGPPPVRLGVPPPGRRRPRPGGQAGQRWLLVRRNRRTGELAFYRCWTPRPVSLATLVRVAGRRWTIEERFQTGKGLVGLDQHQVRRWRSWYRWATLAMLAHAFLVVAAVDRTDPPPATAGLITLTCNEVQHLFAALLARPAGDAGHRLRWSHGDADSKPAPATATTAGRPTGP